MTLDGKMSYGFVGAGWMGTALLTRLNERDDVEIAALCEANADRGREVLGNLGLSEKLLVADYSEITSNPEIDAVWIVSPNKFHARQAIEAMRMGKHVFCEKPCATRFDEYRELIETEQAHPELVTYVDYILYFDTLEERLREMAKAGEFGKLLQVQINYRHPINIAGDKVWKLSREMMGDAIGMGINHSISVMVNVMSSQGTPVAVYASSKEAESRGFESDPIWSIVVRFSNGANGFCFGNIDISNGFDMYHNVAGTAGGFVYDSVEDRHHKVKYWSDKSTTRKWIYPFDSERCERDGFGSLAWPSDATTPDSGDVMQHQTGACVDHFIECIRKGVKSPLGFSNSAAITEIGWAAQMSAATGREIPLPLDFAEAEKLLG